MLLSFNNESVKQREAKEMGTPAKTNKQKRKESMNEPHHRLSASGFTPKLLFFSLPFLTKNEKQNRKQACSNRKAEGRDRDSSYRPSSFTSQSALRINLKWDQVNEGADKNTTRWRLDQRTEVTRSCNFIVLLTLSYSQWSWSTFFLYFL